MKTLKTLPDSGYREMSSLGRKVPEGKKAGHIVRHRRQPRTGPLLEQPVAETAGAVPCQLCGHPVDPKRMHFHMVRYHGIAFRSKNG
jgi:hypothetical protein